MSADEGARDRPARATDESPDPRRWKALAVCLVAGFMTLLDVSIVNVALPSIRDAVGASSSELQWVVSGYALTFGLVLVPSGRLGDMRGRRTMFIVGVTVFTLSSLLAGLAPTALLLVVARLVQGIGGGMLNPQVSGLIQELFRGAERGRAFGMLGTVIGISTAVGPVLGGVIIGALGVDAGWRWIFFVNIPIGAAAVLLSLRLLPAPHAAEGARGHDLDLVGVALLGASVLGILFPLVQEQQWHGNTKWALLVLGLALMAVFVAWERRYAARGREPLVDLSLFSLPGYAPGTTLALVYFAGFTGIFFVLTLFFQIGLGYSALLAGLAVTPFAGGSAVTAAVGGRFVTRTGRSMVVGGLLLVVVGLVLTDVMLVLHGDGHAAAWWTAGPLLLAGVGSGLVISPNQTLTLAHVPVQRAGSAGGVIQTGQRLGTAAGIALIGSVYFATLSSSHGDDARAAGYGLRIAAGLTSVALVIGVIDVLRNRHGGDRREAASPAAAPRG
jgi:EmrB/QacA subfamily drug resistance transporter